MNHSAGHLSSDYPAPVLYEQPAPYDIRWTYIVTAILDDSFNVLDTRVLALCYAVDLP